MNDVNASEVPRDATCLECGYPLIQLTENVCPECGRSFDPGDPVTMRCAENPRKWMRLAAPPTHIESALFIVLSLYALLTLSGPARWEGAMFCLGAFVGAPICLALLGIYFLRVVKCWNADGDRSPNHVARRRRWFVVPVAAVLVMSAFYRPWPLMLRFRLSRPAFDAAVKQVQAGHSIRGRIVGLYYVDNVDMIYYSSRPATVGFYVGSSVADPVGFEFDPHPAHPHGYMCIEVGPGWYTFEE